MALMDYKHYFPIDSIQTVCDLFADQLQSGKEADLALFSIIFGAVESNLTNMKNCDKEAHLNTFAVTASCQILGKHDVHLAISEDHVWVVFGKDGTETAEVTWHGKGNEDKRGRSVGDGISSLSWLYLAGKPVICNRNMELAALVASINPTLTPTIDVHEIAQMQHQLLWLLYDKGYLDAYPMALGNLADLDEYMKVSNCSGDNTEDIVFPGDTSFTLADSTPRPDAGALYTQAIRSARTNYEDRHVYPYTFQGGYYNRHKMFKEAFHAWACAGDVIRQ
ncbi:unnamed protein product [Arctia plantaginis]|uniref:Menin n=1 Tax=Arctia plantaginis TaxID=874455 RepID=A0A8S0YVU0_ARCPL|nr:unnamed protein product [Arctia plantaginis]